MAVSMIRYYISRHNQSLLVLWGPIHVVDTYKFKLEYPCILDVFFLIVKRGENTNI